VSKLQIKYSKEITRELGEIAVYLPGTKVEVGDIIQFPYSPKRIFGKIVPWGSFRKISSLENLGVDFKKPEFSISPHTYRFSSKNSVKVNAGANAGADVGNDDLPGGKGKINIQFSSKGAIYFLGVDCDSKTLDDLAALENEINTNGKEMVWEDTFLVVSVTVAKKALIAQSKTKSSEIIIEGDVKGIQSGTANINTDVNLKVETHSGDVFIKDWSEDVTVFMDVVRFEEEDYGTGGTRSIDEKSKIKLRKVSIEELLTD